MAAIKPSVLARQCRDERVENEERLCKAVAVREQTRHAATGCIDWRIITTDACLKLKHLHPQPLP